MMDAANEDSWRDCLAVLAAADQDDFEAETVLLRNCNQFAVASMMCAIALHLLRSAGTDPSRWAMGYLTEARGA